MFSPDFSRPDWTDDPKRPPENITVVDGRMRPEELGRDSSVIYQFDSPYLISDAWVEGSLVNDDALAGAAISFSTDGGVSWRQAWASSSVGKTDLKLNLGAESNRIGKPSILGLYSYLLRMSSARQPTPEAFPSAVSNSLTGPC